MGGKELFILGGRLALLVSCIVQFTSIQLFFLPLFDRYELGGKAKGVM